MFFTARDLLLRPPRKSAPNLFVGNRLEQSTPAGTAALASLVSAHVDPDDPLTVVLKSSTALPPIRVRVKSAKITAAEVKNYTRAIAAPFPHDLHYLPKGSRLPSNPCLYPDSVDVDKIPARIFLNHGRPLHLLDATTEAPSLAMAFHLANAILHLRKINPKARPVGYYIAPLEGQDKTIVIYRVRNTTPASSSTPASASARSYLLPCPPPIPLVLFTTADPSSSSSASPLGSSEPSPLIMDQALDYVTQARALFGTSFPAALDSDAIFEALPLELI
jgi:hypothetical protein